MPTSKRYQSISVTLKKNQKIRQKTLNDTNFWSLQVFKQYFPQIFLLSVGIRNQTSISDFLIMGFSPHQEQHPLLFGLYLAMYLVTVIGKLLIILAIGSDPQLHIPMYFFLANLSLINTCFS